MNSSLTTLEPYYVIDTHALIFTQDAAVPEMHHRIIVGLARRLAAPLISSDPLIIAAGIVPIVW